ncbi:unnamed protein product [Mortierella alpina]
MAHAQTNSELVPENFKDAIASQNQDTASHALSPAVSEARQSRSGQTAPAPSSSFLQPVVTDPRGLLRDRRDSTPSLSGRSDTSHHYPFSAAHSRRSSLGAHLEAEQHGFFDLATYGRSQDTRSDSSDSSNNSDHSTPTTSNLRHRRSTSLSMESKGSSNSVPFAPPPPPPPSAIQKFRDRFSKRVIKRHIKFILAIYLASLLTLIRPVGNFLGPSPFLANTTVVFMHPARTVGSQLEVTLFSAIGAVIAMGWIIPYQLLVTYYNGLYLAQGNTWGWTIEALLFFVGIWVMTTVKARYAKLTGTFLIFTIANIFAHGKTHGSVQFDIFILLQLIVPMMLGVLICLVVNIVLWPETASERLGRSLHESLDTSRTLLNLSTRYFLLNHKAIALPQSVIENAQQEVRSAQKKLFRTYREARYEVTYSFTNPEDYKDVRTVISALMRHLGSMSLVVQNERLLMLGHPDRDDNDLHTDNEDESDSDGDNADDEETGEGTDSESGTGGETTPRPLAARVERQTSASELRRIRQLLLRAEHSTTAAIGARVQQQQKQRQQYSASGQDSRKALRRGSILAPSATGSGRIYQHEETETPPLDSVLAPALREGVNSSANLAAIPIPDIKVRPVSILSFEESQQMQGECSIQPTVNPQPKQSPRQSLSHSRSCPNLQANVDPVESTVQGSELALAKQTSGTNFETCQRHLDRKGKSKNELPMTTSVNHWKERSRLQKDAQTRSRDDAKTEKRRAARQVMAESALRDIPPKEVAFGDRKVFISFLEIVREPVQRLSDSCSRVMVAMERDLVVGLDTEQDRLERLRKRSSRREAVVRKADASLRAEDGRQSFRRGAGSGTSLPSHDQGSHPDETVGQPPDTEQKPTTWARLWSSVGGNPALTQSERDFTTAWRATGSGRDFKRDRSAESVHSRPAQRKSSWISRIPSSLRSKVFREEDESILPMDISYVEYLSHELEVFDRAEAAGLQVFIATHPTLDVGPREEVCLIFFFIFALREITQELLRLARHVEKLEAQEKEEMARRGQSKPKKRLWWPKVIGNFWHWIAWGSDSQAQASEGYAGMVMNSVKNLEKNQPGLVAEEKFRVEARISKETRLAADKLAADRLAADKLAADRLAAENAVSQEPAVTSLRSLRRRTTVLFDGPRSRRAKTFTASFWKRQPMLDIERGVDANSRPLAEATAGFPEGQDGPIPAHGLQAPVNIYSDTQQSIHPFSAGPQADEDMLDLGSVPVMHEKSPEEVGTAGTELPLPSADGKEAGLPDQAFMSVETQGRDINGQTTQGMESIRQAGTTELLSKDRAIQSQLAAPLLQRTSTHYQHCQGQPSPPGEKSPAVATPITNTGYGSVVGATSQRREGQTLKMSRDRRVPLLRLPAQEVLEADDDSESDISQGRTAEKIRNKQGKKARRTTSITPMDAKRKQPLPPPVHNTIFVNVSKPKTLRYRFWEYLEVFQSDEVRYGFKMALALTFVGFWAWLELTGMLRAADRGQWTMMTIMAVLSPTIGATFSVCAIRIGGTLVGTTWALIAYLIYPDNPFVTSAMFSVIAVVGVILILDSKHPLMGVIMTLSFSSVSFAKYHKRTNETIYEICYKQVVNITLGIVFSVILNTFLWPVLARRELRKEIAQLIGRQGVLFAEMMNRFMLQDPEQAVVEYRQYILQSRQEPSELDDEKADYDTKASLEEGEVPAEAKVAATEETKKFSFGETSGAGVGTMKPLHAAELAPGHTALSYDNRVSAENRPYHDDGASLCRHAVLNADQIAFQHVEHQLQTRILKITQLLELSRSEPRLKETFPDKLYKQIVQCCQNILDRIVSMRMAAQVLTPEVRDLVIGPMNYYRRDLVGALLLYFSVISSSLASKTALPPFLPSARLARLRVVTSVRNAILEHQAQTGEDHYTYIYYFAFSSALEEVIEELELLAILIKPIVGITLLTSYGGYGVPTSEQGYPTQPPLPPSIQGSVPSMGPPDSSMSTPRTGEIESGYWRAAELDGSSSPQTKAIANSFQAASRIFSGQGQDLHFDAGKAAANVHLSHRAKGTGSVVQDGSRSPSTSTGAGKAPGLDDPTPVPFATPIFLTDDTSLRRRRSLRYKEAIATAQEASGLETVEIPSPLASESHLLQVIVSPPPTSVENTQTPTTVASNTADSASPHSHRSSPLQVSSTLSSETVNTQ